MKKILFMFLLACAVATITSCQKEPEIVYLPQPGNPGNSPTDSENKPTDSENKPADSENKPTDSENKPTDSENQPSYSSPFIGNW